MEIFNNYLMFKLLFDGNSKPRQRTHRNSIQGPPNWRGSSTDMSQTHQPLRKRLLRRRSGPLCADETLEKTIPAESYDASSAEPISGPRSRIKTIGRFPTVAECHQRSVDQTPEIQITPVEKSGNFDLLRPEPQSVVERIKQKLCRKRSGSLPETQADHLHDDKNKLAPPHRYEAAASMDPKRKESAPPSLGSSLGSTPTSIPPLIPQTPLTSSPVFAECFLPTHHAHHSQRPVSAMGSLTADYPISPNVLGPTMSAGSSPSLLDLYLISSRKGSVADDYGKMVDEMDSVVLDLGYHYNKPVCYARSVPVSTGHSGDTSRKDRVHVSRSCSPYDYADEIEAEDEDSDYSPKTPPPSRSGASRQTSKGETSTTRRHPLIDSVMQKLRSLKRIGSLRIRSADRCESKATPERSRWRLTRAKKTPKQMSPPSIFVQNMMGSGDNNTAADQHKTSGVWHPPTGRPIDRSLSCKRSTSAPSPRFSNDRSKSNAADYSSQGKRRSFRKKPCDTRQDCEELPSDPIIDFIECKTNAGVLIRSATPLLHPGYSPPKEPEVLLTMSFSPTMGFITATVNKARNVPQNAESYLRVYLFEGTKVLERKQTPGIMGKAEPEFKQAYVFTLGNTKLALVHILIELFSRDVIGPEKVLGNIIIGPKAGGTGSVQWLRMVKNPNFPCSMWHTLNENY